MERFDSGTLGWFPMNVMDDHITIVFHHGGRFVTKEDEFDDEEECPNLCEISPNPISIPTRNPNTSTPPHTTTKQSTIDSTPTILISNAATKSNVETTSIIELPPIASANTPTKSTTTNEAKPTTSKPNSSKLTTAKPTTSKPKSSKYTTANPTTSKPNQSKPTTTKPTISKPNLSTTVKSTPPVTISASRSTPKVQQNEHSNEDDSSNSSDSYESAEDSLYKLGAIESSTETETDSGGFEVTKKNHKLKHAPVSSWSKEKQKMLLDEDMLMVNSDEEVDLVEVLGNKTAA
nr:salivary glue protein Sgs-3-like [Arachis hypogaea]